MKATECESTNISFSTTRRNFPNKKKTIVNYSSLQITILQNYGSVEFCYYATMEKLKYYTENYGTSIYEEKTWQITKNQETLIYDGKNYENIPKYLNF